MAIRRRGAVGTAVEGGPEEAPNWLPPGGRCFIVGDGDDAFNDDGSTVFVVEDGTDLRRVVWSLQHYFSLPAGYVLEGRVELRVVRRQAPGKGERS